MHVFALVIVPGPRAGAIDLAYEVLNATKRRRYDYAHVGGRFEARLPAVMDTPTLVAVRDQRRHDVDAWQLRQDSRRRARATAWESDEVRELAILLGGDLDHERDPRPPDPIQAKDCVALTRALSRPLPVALSRRCSSHQMGTGTGVRSRVAIEAGWVRLLASSTVTATDTASSRWTCTSEPNLTSHSADG